MALSIPVDRGNPTRTGDTTTLVSDTFTPAANTLLLTFVSNDNGDPSTPTGHDGGSPWVKLTTSQTQGGTTGSLWGAHSGASPSSGEINVAEASSGSMGAAFIEQGGADVSGTVANSFNSVIAAKGYGTGLTSTLSPTPTDLSIGFFGNRQAGNLTAAATILHNNISWAYGDRKLATNYTEAGDATHTATNSSSGDWFTFAVDVKEAGVGGESLSAFYNKPMRLIKSRTR